MVMSGLKELVSACSRYWLSMFQSWRICLDPVLVGQFYSLSRLEHAIVWLWVWKCSRFSLGAITSSLGLVATPVSWVEIHMPSFLFLLVPGTWWLWLPARILAWVKLLDRTRDFGLMSGPQTIPELSIPSSGLSHPTRFSSPSDGNEKWSFPKMGVSPNHPLGFSMQSTIHFGVPAFVERWYTQAQGIGGSFASLLWKRRRRGATFAWLGNSYMGIKWEHGNIRGNGCEHTGILVGITTTM